MSLWTSSVIALILLQTFESHAQQATSDSRPVAIEAVAKPSEELPPKLVFTKKDWFITQAYRDVFNILSKENPCSSFYGGPRAATIVLNDLVKHVQSEPLYREIAFHMGGEPRFIRDYSTGVVYRLFARTTVNTNGSFYQRRVDPMRNSPQDVGNYLPGSRPARALILLHELGHLIEGENGAWLLPNDGNDTEQSKANTLRVQQVCRPQLKMLE